MLIQNQADFSVRCNLKLTKQEEKCLYWVITILILVGSRLVSYLNTVLCVQGSSNPFDPFYSVSYYIKLVKTSGTYSDTSLTVFTDV